MAIIKQLDKRSGITYVYDSKSYRDPETKKVRSKRTLIGKLDPETGDIIPTDGRGKKRSPNYVPEPGEYSDAKVHPFRKFRAPFSGKAEHTFPE